jgi:hypothetical protein
VVEETGDKFRNTVALTVRGDGVGIPPYIIIHTYKTASFASGRRCSADDEPVKGMNIPRMIDYIDHIAQYVEETSLLVMDRLSSHTAANICRHCDIVGTESIDSLRNRFMNEIGSVIPPQLEEELDFYDAWKSGFIQVEGASRGRGVHLAIPDQLPESYLDGVYWNSFRG